MEEWIQNMPLRITDLIWKIGIISVGIEQFKHSNVPIPTQLFCEHN